MALKRIFVMIAAVLLTSAVLADSSSVTSKKYVDDFMAGYQNKIPGSGADKLMIYDDTDGIGAKQIVSSLGDDTSATNIPDVGAVKDALDGKQDTINGTPGYVMTGMGTNRPGEVGERAIYGMTFYGNSLVTAENVNDGVINAVNSSLIRVDENGNPSDSGTLWEINTDLFALGVLPAGYTQLEWIESTGTQYIDTGIIVKANTLVKSSFEFTSATPSTRRLFGMIAGPSSGTMGYREQYNFYWFTSIGATTSSVSKHTVDFNADGNVYLDGTSIGSKGTFGTATNVTMLLFAEHSDGFAINYGQVKVYSFTVKEGDTVIQNLIPAKNASNVIGMYDTVSGTFFTNAATSGPDFTAGPPVAN